MKIRAVCWYDGESSLSPLPSNPALLTPGVRVANCRKSRPLSGSVSAFLVHRAHFERDVQTNLLVYLKHRSGKDNFSETRLFDSDGVSSHGEKSRQMGPLV